MSSPPHFTHFLAPISSIELPIQLNNPFYANPHDLCHLAAAELQTYLQHQTDFDHNFGIDKTKSGLVYGKMFGVLVVQNKASEIGYLAAFSGKLANSNHHARFVPPVFDMLTEGSFLNEGMKVLTAFSRQIECLEQAPDLVQLQQQLDALKVKAQQAIAAKKASLEANLIEREKRRASIHLLPKAQQNHLYKALDRAHHRERKAYRKCINEWKEQLSKEEEQIRIARTEIDKLRAQRKATSGALQQRLFDNYFFFNQAKERKSLAELFTTQTPPSGAGECAAPKLFQYAFLHDLKPLAIAEFWWGQSPKSEIRQHGQFYPACNGKCKPILGHMLSGIDLMVNPLLVPAAKDKDIEIVFEDDYLLVVNKPIGMLSVPGKDVQDSVQLRLQERYPTATGPMLVHRLDMATSGLLLAGKSLEIYKDLQKQFLDRSIKKRYVALLEGQLEADKGMVDLPIGLDYYNRPRQLVSEEIGKPARTHWKVIERLQKRTKVHFYPITGRTHQLRVHAAHKEGLNAPIVGDRLYGAPANRLHLHAEWLEFRHPFTAKRMSVKCPADF